MAGVAGIVGSYLVGGVPVGLLIARSRGVDLRRIGSGNIGATNVFRALGAKYGLLSFACDALKGYLPVFLAAKALHLTGWFLGFSAMATVVGHCFSPYLRLAGGKGVATSLGIALALFWPSGVIPLALWIAILAASRYVSLGSVVALVAAPLVAAGLNAPAPTTAALGCTSILCVLRHYENIGRLLAGTENRFGRKKRPEAGPEPEVSEEGGEQ